MFIETILDGRNVDLTNELGYIEVLHSPVNEKRIPLTPEKKTIKKNKHCYHKSIYTTIKAMSFKFFNPACIHNVFFLLLI